MTLEIKFSEQGKYEPRSEMTVIHNGKELYTKRDGGEPEDNYFFRDWSWVSDKIKQAYELGLRDAEEEKKEK